MLFARWIVDPVGMEVRRYVMADSSLNSFFEKKVFMVLHVLFSASIQDWKNSFCTKPGWGNLFPVSLRKSQGGTCITFESFWNNVYFANYVDGLCGIGDSKEKILIKNNKVYNFLIPFYL